MGLSPLPLEVEIPSDVDCIEAVVAQVVRRCEDAAFPVHHLAFHIPVALTEALSNAILRGNREDLTKSVRVRVAVDAESLVVEVADDGLGFDLEACTLDPTTAENLSREDGRGLFLIRKLVDAVHFNPQGNSICMMLRRP